jgi:hypothetical protein
MSLKNGPAWPMVSLPDRQFPVFSKEDFKVRHRNKAIFPDFFISALSYLSANPKMRKLFLLTY